MNTRLSFLSKAYDNDFERCYLSTKHPHQAYLDPTEGLKKYDPFTDRLEKLKMLERQTTFAEKRGRLNSGYQRKRATQTRPVEQCRAGKIPNERLRNQAENNSKNISMSTAKKNVSLKDEKSFRIEKRDRRAQESEREASNDISLVTFHWQHQQRQRQQQHQQQRNLLFKKVAFITEKKVLPVKVSDMTDTLPKRLVKSANMSNKRDKSMRISSSQLPKGQSNDDKLSIVRVGEPKQEEAKFRELKLEPIHKFDHCLFKTRYMPAYQQSLLHENDNSIRNNQTESKLD